MMFFGEQIRHADDDIPTSKRGPQSLLDFLPDDFSLDDAKRVRRKEGLNNEGDSCIRMIRNWVNRGFVIQYSEFSFKKASKEDINSKKVNK